MSLSQALPQLASNFVYPNVSLNVGGQKSSDFERYSIAVLGVFLQLCVIAYAGVGAYTHGHKHDILNEEKATPGYGFPLIAGGTMTMVLGMFLCARVIDESTSEESWVVPKHETRNLRLVWLQKGRRLPFSYSKTSLTPGLTRWEC